MTSPVHGSGNHGLERLVQALASALLDVAREAGREEAQRAVREALDRRGVGAEWLSQAAAARLAGGVTPATIRSWQASGALSKGRRGRVNAAELRAYLAAEGGGTSATTTVDLGRERVKRAAREILSGKRGGARE